ncbi:hypothetical protein Taro_000822, partial [Colocasia esculenta]|nr:hypothetical protein [Colocasia esculenta]
MSDVRGRWSVPASSLNPTWDGSRHPGHCTPPPLLTDFSRRARPWHSPPRRAVAVRDGDSPQLADFSRRARPWHSPPRRATAVREGDSLRALHRPHPCTGHPKQQEPPRPPSASHHQAVPLPGSPLHVGCQASRSEFCSPANPSRINWSSSRWKLSKDPLWGLIKNDIREIRDMLVAIMQKTDCAADPILDVKCEEQEQVAIYESDVTLADKYEVKMQVQSDLQDSHNEQVTQQNMLSEVSSLMSDSTVCTESEIDDTWDPELFSLSGLQSISYYVFTEDRPAGSSSTVVVDSEFTLEDFDVVWLDFHGAHTGRQLEICDIMNRMAYFTHILVKSECANQGGCVGFKGNRQVLISMGKKQGKLEGQ